GRAEEGGDYDNAFVKLKQRHTISLSIPAEDSVSYIARQIKGIPGRPLIQKLPHLRESCKNHLWASSCHSGSVGLGWDVHIKLYSQRKVSICKKRYIQPLSLSTGFVTEGDGEFVHL
ncbi:MAG: hypothetical protein OIN88_13970, partial [Candidatus Methanoperedens sp.]|nr:hypothetical protein [Candidatus Methanoperedens sp.]